MKVSTLTLARFSLFLVYFWFGILKVLNLSPAEQLVQDLFTSTLSWLMPFGTFYLLFSLFECAIGILFLLKGKEKIAFGLMVLHLITTVLPLFVLPGHTWQAVLVPTLTGQYILKNILILAVGCLILEKTTKS